MKRVTTLRASILVLLLAAIPACATSAAEPVAQTESGIVTLLAGTANVTGSAKVEKLGQIECVTHWRDEKDAATWEVDVTKPGSFELLVTYACALESAGGAFTVDVGDKKVPAKTASTGGWGAQNSAVLGLVKIDEAGKIPVSVHFVSKKGEGLMVLRGVALRPATQEDVDRRTKAAAVPTPQAKGDPLSITVDFAEAPELEDWMRDARLYCAKVYPQIAEAIKTDGFVPPHAFNLRMDRGYNGVAATANVNIFMSVKYVKGHMDDMGMVGHELVHVIQHYKRYNPGWMVEGIADYVRYYVLEPGSPRGRFNPANADYKRGYQPTAGLLNYIVKYYDKDAVRKFNSGLRDGSFKESMIVELTGETADELWEDCKVVLTKR